MHRARTKPYDKALRTAVPFNNPNMLEEPVAGPSGFNESATVSHTRAGTMMPPVITQSQTDEHRGSSTAPASGRQQKRGRK